MRIAILYNDNRVWVEFNPEKFKELLIKYTQKYKDVSMALDAIEKDLKRETSNK